MKNKVIWIWSGIAFLYALIPTLVSLLSGSSGDNSLFMSPPFILAGLTLTIAIFPVAFFYHLFGLSQHSLSFEIFSHVLNLILWLLIGIALGKYFGRKKRKDVK